MQLSVENIEAMRNVKGKSAVFNEKKFGDQEGSRQRLVAASNIWHERRGIFPDRENGTRGTNNSHEKSRSHYRTNVRSVKGMVGAPYLANQNLCGH